MCDEAVNNSTETLKLVPDWFVASKMIKKLFTALFPDENIFYFHEGSGDAVFNLSIDLTDISLDNNFDEDDPDTIILTRLLVWHIKSTKLKEPKKELNEELMLVVWHPDK